MFFYGEPTIYSTSPQLQETADMETLKTLMRGKDISIFQKEVKYGIDGKRTNRCLIGGFITLTDLDGGTIIDIVERTSLVLIRSNAVNRQASFYVPWQSLFEIEEILPN